MKKSLSIEERLERFRLLAERRELEDLDQRTPSQLRRLAALERVLAVAPAAPVEKVARDKKGSAAA